MSKRSSPNTVTVFDLWMPFSRLLMTSAEMAVAAAQTIGHRTALMGRSEPKLTAAEQRELLTMGSEKVHAAARSAQAMFGVWPTFNRQLFDLYHRQWNIMTAAGGLGSAHTWADLALAQQRWWQAAWKGGGAMLGVWIGAMNMAQKGMFPIHARATANAKRLTLAAERTAGAGSKRRGR